MPVGTDQRCRSLLAQHYPCRRVIACLFPAADIAIDTGFLQAVVELRAKQEMIDTQPCIAAIGIAEIVPKSIDLFCRMKFPDRVGPSLRDELLEGGAGFRPEQGVIHPSLGLVYVQVGWHDVEVSG